MTRNNTYWLINTATKQYTTLNDVDGYLFDGDWKAQTLFAEKNYIDLDVQPIHQDQKENDYLFYNYDLSISGMIVGVYADMDHVTDDDIQAFLTRLKNNQDVAQSYIHRLTRFQKSAEKEKTIDQHQTEKQLPRTTSDNPLRPYCVILHEDPADKFELRFECMAEDAEHAKEQAENAYPGCEVVLVTFFTRR